MVSGLLNEEIKAKIHLDLYNKKQNLASMTQGSNPIKLV